MIDRSSPSFDHPPYSPGDVIVKSEALLYSLWPEFIRSCCSGCLNVSKNPEINSFLIEIQSFSAPKLSLFKCSGCLQVSYCSVKCQKSDWAKFHKYECKILAKFGDAKIFRTKYGLVYLRGYILLTKRPQELTKMRPILGGGQKCYMDLVHHDEMKNESRLHSMFSVLFHFRTVLGLEFDAEKLVEVLLKFHINSFTVIDKVYHSNVGAGLYIETSIFDHSCQPNSFAAFDGINMSLRATTSIAQNEPIHVAYQNILESRNLRREKLRSDYYFDCNCTRCSNVDDETDANCEKIMSLTSKMEKFDKFTLTNVSEEEKESNRKKIVQMYTELINLSEKVRGKYHPFVSREKLTCLLFATKFGIDVAFKIEEIIAEYAISHGCNDPVLRFLCEMVYSNTSPDDSLALEGT